MRAPLKASLPLVRLPPNAAIHRFGTPNSAPRSSALLRFPTTGWTIDQKEAAPQQGWAIVGDAEGRRLAVETLLGRQRISPVAPPPGPFPYISSLLASSSNSTDTLEEIPKPIRHLAFARPPVSGEFTDFTARYGALQEEDKLTFRQTLSALSPSPSTEAIERVAKIMRIDHLLDLPSVSQSSGQTRRGRIAAAMLSRPVLLLLEDPMAGLDIKSRAEVSKLLGEMNSQGEMRVVLVLRAKGAGDMPEWVTDVCDVTNGDVWIGRAEEWKGRPAVETEAQIKEFEDEAEQDAGEGEPVVKLQDISVSYGEGTRPVLNEVSWTIRPGSRWHLQGANGSGKTTLLSLILGHHPRSYSLPSSSLTLFSKPRRSIASPTLRTLIGHTSPEIFASFPRSMGLTAFQAIGTGFEGVFSRRAVTPEQKERILSLVEYFAPLLATSRSGQLSDGNVIGIAKRNFAHFTPPQQALLLFLRAIVSRPPLVILDEPSQGMDEVIWDKCKELLKKEWAENPSQAVVVVSHYDDEVPWSKSRGRVLKLVDGRASSE